MNLKSITFRCSERQHERLLLTLNRLNTTRTNFISEALDAFLEYAEQDYVRNMSLFDLVNDIDSIAGSPSFADQA